MSWLFSRALNKMKSPIKEASWKPNIAASAIRKSRSPISTSDQKEIPITRHARYASGKWPRTGISGIESPQKKSIGSGARKTLKPSSVIAKRTGRSTTAKKSCASTALMSIGLTNKCSGKAGRASAVSESSFGVTNKNRPMSITATKRARFAGFSAIDATRCSACAAMTPTFFQHWRGI